MHFLSNTGLRYLVGLHSLEFVLIVLINTNHASHSALQAQRQARAGGILGDPERLGEAGGEEGGSPSHQGARFLRGDWEELYAEAPGDRRATAEADEERVLRDAAVQLVKAGQAGKGSEEVGAGQASAGNGGDVAEAAATAPCWDRREDRRRSRRSKRLSWMRGCRALAAVREWLAVARLVALLKDDFDLCYGIEANIGFRLGGVDGSVMRLVKSKEGTQQAEAVRAKMLKKVEDLCAILPALNKLGRAQAQGLLLRFCAHPRDTLVGIHAEEEQGLAEDTGTLSSIASQVDCRECYLFEVAKSVSIGVSIAQ
ncbi:hypothetical protein CYMTET_19609 [Cymbomonas tetramitiformis]|uniref:Uncharacterized protein n=1 Tax=Cymbomonas tetramitiformis TaxID=36881 RepID=A0AAE0G5R2_9CHLO|nr:hypothetical protein CYMTET_19609 [Cymbomonas tetramitiformis]